MHNKALNLEALNKAQYSAVTHGEGALLVLAGPGSGKTFTITQRIWYLMEVGKVAPEKILVITFTKEAALSMQRRFQEQTNRTYPVNFGTFHSIFYQILRKSNPSCARQLLQGTQKKDIIISILKQYNQSAGEQKAFSLQEDAANYLASISYYKNTDNMEGALLRLAEDKREPFYEIFRSYEQIRRSRGGIDFDDMVYECAALLERDVHARNYWRTRFSHILMDEFQDINPMQYRVISLLAAEPYNLFAVGDDDQAIYGFRGSSPECMKQFLEDYQAKRVLLDINYRSAAPIVKASLQVIGENKERFSKELHPYNEVEMEEVRLIPFMEQEEEYTYLTRCLQSRTEKDSCAVLFRTNLYMQSFAARLNRLGIAYDCKEKISIYEHFVVKDIMAYLQLGMGNRRRELYLQILNKPQRRISRELLEAKTDRELWMLEKQLDYLRGKSLYLGIQYICRVIGYEHYLKTEAKKHGRREECLEEWMQIVEWLKEEARHYESLQEWMEAQKNVQKQPLGQEKDAAVSRVQLMTVHASKGLEFDRVYIPDCNEKNYPHGSMPEGEECEEERRIFYVAMTRAKKNLELLYHTGTKERPRLPSRFLNPLIHQ